MKPAMLISMLTAAASPPPSAPPPDFRQMWTFATVSARPSFADGAELAIGTFEHDPDPRSAVYWFVRRAIPLGSNVRTMTGYTNSRLCPLAMAPLVRLETLRMPQPDIMGHGPELRFTTVDGTVYTLEGRSLHADGQVGEFMIESSSGSPLARWTDAMMLALAPCWVDTPTP